MKKQEILKASEEYIIKLYGPLADSADEQSHFIAGAEMVNKKQPYSEEDLASFGRYVKKNWTVIDSGGWVEINRKFYKPHDVKTDEQVIKLWEKSK